MKRTQSQLNRATMQEESLVGEEEQPVTRTEVMNVSGNQIVSKVSELLREGNTHRIMVIDSSGHVILNIPTIVGVAGTLLFPAAAAIAVTGAVASNLQIVIEKTA